MQHAVLTMEYADCAADHDAVAMIAPAGIDTEFQRFQSFDVPDDGWRVSIVAEARSGQRAVVLQPQDRHLKPRLSVAFSAAGTALPDDAYTPEGTPLSIAALDLAQDARDIARRAGGGLAGIAAIVEATSSRFDYGDDPTVVRWYEGQEAVPNVVCGVGNCIDINTYLVAALRAAGYETAYLTCYFFCDDPDVIKTGCHCWVRTRYQGTIQDWDIAHFKKAGRSNVFATLNPVPGRRFAVAYGRDHTYLWNGITIEVPSPLRPQWVRADGRVVWGKPPHYRLAAA